MHGQRNWIRLVGPFRLQPSEFAKLGLILWSADLFARREAYLHQWRALLVPFMPMVAVVVGLVVLEGDLGTAIVLSIIVAGLLFVVGAPMRIFVAFGAVGLAGIAMLSLTAGYRMRRFTAWLHPEADLDGAGWQLTQGKVALGTGGLVGGRARWQPGEVGGPARGPHRLHLPGHRRGARALRRADRAGAVRGDHHLRPAHGHPDQ